MDASLQTHLLSHWVREKQALTLEQAVRMLSFDTATHWGFAAWPALFMNAYAVSERVTRRGPGGWVL